MGCSIYRNNMFYCRCPVVNGLYVLNLEELLVYNISNKKPWINDSSPTYLWHYRLVHINEKRMKKLHDDGLLTSFDFDSFKTCESCLLGKMTKTPFTGTGERASDLLGLVHTDVCGPMSTIAR